MNAPSLRFEYHHYSYACKDVVVPLPLPLSAILILVIGERIAVDVLELLINSSQISASNYLWRYALRSTALRTVLSLISAFICLGQTRDQGRIDEDAASQAW